jgi:protein arginine kinase
MTLGTLEEDILSNLSATVARVMEREHSVRESLLRTNGLEIEDLVFRSLGVLHLARKLNTQEAMEHISNLKLGAGLGLLPQNAQQLFSRLLTDVQSAALEQREGEELTQTQRDEARAKVVRETLKKELHYNE